MHFFLNSTAVHYFLNIALCYDKCDPLLITCFSKSAQRRICNDDHHDLCAYYVLGMGDTVVRKTTMVPATMELSVQPGSQIFTK